MTTQLHVALKRTTIVLAAATLAVGVFASGVLAGSARGGGDHEDRAMDQPRSSFWSYDLETGNPTGPNGEPDFWNYDPKTGAKISDSSPGLSPDELAELWSAHG